MSDLTDHMKPLAGIPRVRAVNPDGSVLAEGYYYYHVNRQVSPFDDSLKPEDIDQCIVSDGFADWNMPQSPRIQKVEPPTRIEIIPEPTLKEQK